MATANSVGYSGTPLAKKLGLKEGGTLVALRAPREFAKWLSPIPANASVKEKLALTNALVILFCHNAADLKKALSTVCKKLMPDGSLWIAWPKKSSPLFLDLTEDGIRTLVLPTGLVDVKVCAISADWSGLKCMVRKELRANWNR